MNREEAIKLYFKERRNTTVAYYQYLNRSREYVPGITLHMRELDFLRAICTVEESTILKMAEALGVTHGAVSQTATRLTKKGLVIRSRKGNDQRSNVVKLTALGELIMDLDNQLEILLAEKLNENLSPFSTDEFLNAVSADRAMQKTLVDYDKIISDFMNRDPQVH